jgi:hypothetical protein
MISATELTNICKMQSATHPIHVYDLDGVVTAEEITLATV